jgi:hypothetical protein
MRADAANPTLRICIKVTKDGLVRVGGEALPKLREGSVGELVVKADMVEDEGFVARFLEDRTTQLLPSGVSVFLGVSPLSVPGHLVDERLIKPERLGLATRYLLVEVILNEALMLRIRGDSDTSLQPCKCCVPVLRLHPGSINHAFTRISEFFETERISHTANVFERAFVKIGTRWEQLHTLRLRALAPGASGSAA